MGIEDVKNLVGSDVYDREVKSLKNGETKTIYSNNSIDIDIKKVSSKVYVIVNKFGTRSLNSCLNKICSLF
ncbi:hypothetical protein ACEE21_15300 [Clostridium baratii]